jgi:hypothetical protein
VGDTQLAMGDCYLHDFPGRKIALRKLCQTPEAEDLLWAASALDAVEELRTVVEPLSVTLRLGCRDKSLKWRDRKAYPPYPTWFIRESFVPEGIIIKPVLVDAQVAQAPELTTEVLTAWIEQAFQQQCPCPHTHDVAWYALYFQAVRSRIYNEKNFQSRDTFILEQYKAQCEFPIEHRKDGLWVYSPIELLDTEPSLKYMIINEEGALTLDMNVHWSWWTETSPEDRQALEQAMLRIIDRGWKIEYCDQVFGLSA